MPAWSSAASLLVLAGTAQAECLPREEVIARLLQYHGETAKGHDLSKRSVSNVIRGSA